MKIIRLLLLLACLGLSACATEKAVLHLNLSQGEETKGRVFPPLSDEEVPRYVFIGELFGEQNFVVPESERQGNPLLNALKWIVGLFESPQPIVLQRPQSGVVDEEGRILVTDVSRGAVFVFDERKGEIEVWEHSDGYRHFSSPTGIALGPDGRVFVADSDMRRVVMLDHNGQGVGIIGKDQLVRPVGLAWDSAAGLLYVADTQAHQIKVFDILGNLVETIGERGEGPGEFNYPTYIALNQGKLYVADTMNARLQVLHLDGSQPPLIVGQRGVKVGDFARPKGIGVDSENNIYAVESYNDHLLIFDRRAQFLLPIGGTGNGIGSFYLPGGLWIDARNRIFVADTFNGRIVIFQFLGGGVESESSDEQR